MFSRICYDGFTSAVVGDSPLKSLVATWRLSANVLALCELCRLTAAAASSPSLLEIVVTPYTRYVIIISITGLKMDGLQMHFCTFHNNTIINNLTTHEAPANHSTFTGSIYRFALLHLQPEIHLDNHRLSRWTFIFLQLALTSRAFRINNKS